MLTLWILMGISCLFILAGVRIARVRQGLLIVNRLTGSVSRLAIGPDLTFVIPWLEDVVPVDLTIQLSQMQPESVVTSDQFAVDARLDLIFAHDAARLQTTDWNGILPFLPVTRMIVELLAGYLLRSAVIQFPLDALLAIPGNRIVLEGTLRQTLNDRLVWLGVHILDVRLILSPTPFMLEAEIAARAQARALATLIDTVGLDQAQLAQLLPLHLLQNNAHPAHLVTTLQINPTGVGAEPVNGPAPLLWLAGGNE